MATTNKTPPTKVKGLSVAAKRERFFSAQITEPFGFEARAIPLSSLKKEQIEELKADPYLVVKEIEIEVEAQPEA